MEELHKAQNPYKKRQTELIHKIAEAAYHNPLLESSLWFHNDVRNNFYYASYLFAAAVDIQAEVSFDRKVAKNKAEAVLLEVLMLQNRQPGTELYGHWPLGLHPVPREAPPHELPVEIMGGLMAYFFREYGERLSTDLQIEFQTAFIHIYNSDFFRKPVITYGHHEAKYTAAKIIFGTLFNDVELVEDGRRSLEETLTYIRAKGMPEYGCLPWFWHWVQAFTCALEFADAEDSDLHTRLKEMLDHLWSERAQFYLQGSWVGAHSRGWPHDVPGDANVLHDYVQFGDFQLPEVMPRTEYAGFLFYEAPANARKVALDRNIPVEVAKVTQKVIPTVPESQPLLHSYAYITEEYAVGGMWERVEEFDNEQLRWTYSLPLSGLDGTNQLYFFNPGQGYNEGDLRHQSRYGEVLFHQSVVMELYPVPFGEPNQLIGVLPKGEWLQKQRALFGKVGNCYFAAYLSHPYELIDRGGFIEVSAEGLPGGIVVEAVSVKDAAELGIIRFEEFANKMIGQPPKFSVGETNPLQADYTSLRGDRLQLHTGGKRAATINGNPISFDKYSV
ncbi:hypothetical protein EJP82_24250 [Paenibacillus anaericanus]|uniref:Uncharacterized protein n=1 Tax=Paenibacillus anaericanus TaxID=170367 RepID=A0A3S1DGL4_9BACL|nr:hypothetical protein [Paenibacillus anaericanus]RUT40694.1 hypothetical protein EJP82_24250 [Paenibacillus anaericanus]